MLKYVYFFELSIYISTYSVKKPPKTAMFDPKRPYNDLPPLPPSQDIQTVAILKACIPANQELGKLKEAVKVIPNPMLLLNTLRLKEVKASSAIENIITTDDNLFSALSLKTTPIDPSTKEVMNYNNALFLGVKELSANSLLTTNLFEKICTKIKRQDSPIRQIMVNLKNDNTGKIIYTPPEGEERLRELLANLEKFIHEHQEINPLIKMAVIHYQFEAIHPFHDGNGRTGRILNILYLIKQGLLDDPILYLSRHFIDSRNDYYRLLNEVTQKGAWEAWIIYMLNAVEHTARHTLDMVDKIKKLHQHYLWVMDNQQPKYSKVELKRGFIELIFELPYIRIRNVMERLKITRITATKHLRNLEMMGILSEKQYGREILFINDPLIQLIKTGDLNQVRSDIKSQNLYDQRTKIKIEDLLNE